jgi:hypothetical protein
MWGIKRLVAYATSKWRCPIRLFGKAIHLLAKVATIHLQAKVATGPPSGEGSYTKKFSVFRIDWCNLLRLAVCSLVADDFDAHFGSIHREPSHQ